MMTGSGTTGDIAGNSTLLSTAAVHDGTTSAQATQPRSNPHSRGKMDDMLQTYHKQMSRMDVLEERIKYRCLNARRRLVQLLDQQYQQQLYGSHDVDASLYISNSNNNNNNNSVSTFPNDPNSTMLPSNLNASTTSINISAFSTAAAVTQPLQQQQTRRDVPMPFTRDTHVRMIIHHSYQPEVTAAGAMAALMQKQVIATKDGVLAGTSGNSGSTTTTSTSTINMRMCKPSPPIWTLHIEGKLLIDHLDYQSAKLRDTTGATKRKRSAHNSATGSARNITKEPIATPLKLTHLFNKAIVTFQTNFVLIDHKTKSSGGSNNTTTPTKGSKKSRRAGTATTSIVTVTDQQKSVVDDATEALNNLNAKEHGADSSSSYKSKLQQVIWTLQTEDDIKTDESTNTTSGADMWSFMYTEPKSPDKIKYKVHSVIAVVELYRRLNYCTASSSTPSTSQFDTTTATPATSCANTRYYRVVSSTLQKSLFPHHGPITTDVLTGTTMNMNSTTHQGIVDQLLSSQHNQVHIPIVLTIQEIIHTFFTYIQDHHLILVNDNNNNNGDVVQCDTTLQQLLNMEQFSFSQLRSLLHQRQLVEPVLNTFSPFDPVRISYIMEKDAASTSLLPQKPTAPSTGSNSAKTDSITKQQQEDNPNLSCLQLDMDIRVPHYLMYCICDLLQGMKLREQEYVSCRLKGRLRLLSTLPTYASNNNINNDGNAAATANMTMQARRFVQQAALTARDDDEKHVRQCIDEWIVRSSKEANDSMKKDGDSSLNGTTPTVPPVKDMVPFIPMTLAQSASVLNSEPQSTYKIDTRIEYLLQQLESASNLAPNIINMQELYALLNSDAFAPRLSHYGLSR